MNLKRNNSWSKSVVGVLLYGALIALFPVTATAQQKIIVGSKHFNEGYILSEIVAQVLENEGFAVERKFNLGGTAVSFEALRTGAINIYPEYSGTIASEILKSDRKISLDEIGKAVQQQYQLEISQPYGFNNTYAIVMNGSIAGRMNIATISDLAGHPELKGGLSYEFLKREDGWQHLTAFYNLRQTAAGMEHGLSYNALTSGNIDFTDAYSTDGEIQKYGLVVLKDDRHFFPEYSAVNFYQRSLPEKAKTALQKLQYSIDENKMQQMNAMALFQKKDFATIASEFLTDNGFVRAGERTSQGDLGDLWQHILKHLLLTFLYRHQLFLNPVLYLTGIFQTIPSIALLALMIPLLGIGIVPSITALCIYALLPILRNTISGLKGVDPQLKSVATAIGLNPSQQLRLVEFPLAVPAILSGIRIATVINVGTATLAAFIGSGGLGEYIVTGLALNNTNLILKGAIPAAVLAIGIELLFELVEKKLIPKHLAMA
jgi:osmoprotectant transport system permease protein